MVCWKLNVRRWMSILIRLANKWPLMPREFLDATGLGKSIFLFYISLIAGLYYSRIFAKQTRNGMISTVFIHQKKLQECLALTIRLPVCQRYARRDCVNVSTRLLLNWKRVSVVGKIERLWCLLQVQEKLTPLVLPPIVCWHILRCAMFFFLLTATILDDRQRMSSAHSASLTMVKLSTLSMVWSD